MDELVDATFQVIYFPLRFGLNTKNATKILEKNIPTGNDAIQYQG